MTMPTDQTATNSDLNTPCRVAFIPLEHFSMMAFTGAVDALVTANLTASKTLYEFEVLGIDQLACQSDLGIEITCNATLEQSLNTHFDKIIICGGYRVELVSIPLLKQYLQHISQRHVLLGSLWNGSYFLADAGLLDNQLCTVHPASRTVMQEQFPQTKLSNRSFVIEAQHASSAGANSALDMMLALIQQAHGETLVRAVDEVLSCDRSNDLSCETPPVEHDIVLPPALKTALALMKNNIEEPLSIDELAQYVSLSRRQLERLFLRYMKSTPSKYYIELRMGHAKQLLLNTQDSVTDIAIACGFMSTTHFSHCFRNHFGHPPSQVRQQR